MRACAAVSRSQPQMRLAGPTGFVLGRLRPAASSRGAAIQDAGVEIGRGSSNRLPPEHQCRPSSAGGCEVTLGWRRGAVAVFPYRQGARPRRAGATLPHAVSVPQLPPFAPEQTASTFCGFRGSAPVIRTDARADALASRPSDPPSQFELRRLQLRALSRAKDSEIVAVHRPRGKGATWSPRPPPAGTGDEGQPERRRLAAVQA